jgi:hypothetical protein
MENRFSLTLTGRPSETNRPAMVFRPVRTRGKENEPARLRLRPKSVPTQHGRALPRTSHAGARDRGGAVAADGQRPFLVASGQGEARTRIAMKRRT